jgi:hypothetical protein
LNIEMDVVAAKYREYSTLYNQVWEKRDRRVDGWLLMDSPIPTMLLCATYVYIVKVWGPNYMRDRKPMNIRGFLIAYNAFQVAFSTYIFLGVNIHVFTQSFSVRKTSLVLQLFLSGWAGDYSFRCQPVDYSNSAKGLSVRNVQI